MPERKISDEVSKKLQSYTAECRWVMLASYSYPGNKNRKKADTRSVSMNVCMHASEYMWKRKKTGKICHIEMKFFESEFQTKWTKFMYLKALVCSVGLIRFCFCYYSLAFIIIICGKGKHSQNEYGAGTRTPNPRNCRRKNEKLVEK